MPDPVTVTRKMYRKIIGIGIVMGFLWFSQSVWALTIISPEDGAIVHIGDTVTVRLQVDTGEPVTDVCFESDHERIFNEARGDPRCVMEPPFDMQFVVPEYTKTIAIEAFGNNFWNNNELNPDTLDNKIYRARPITLNILPPLGVTLQGIDAYKQGLPFSIYYNRKGEPIGVDTEYLSVRGIYSDGVLRRLNHDPNLVFTSSDKTVVNVNRIDDLNYEGIIKAIEPGDARITVEYGSHKDFVYITVFEKLCPPEAIDKDGKPDTFRCFPYAGHTKRKGKNEKGQVLQ